MKRTIFYALMLAPSVTFAAQWVSVTRTDAMTDEETTETFVESTTGDKFSLLRRSDESVWGYLQLASPNQFSVGEQLMARIDKNEPREFNDKLEKLTADLGMKVESWEWNPSLIGFRLWHGKKDEGCGYVRQLYDGKRLVIRYHPNQSTTRDIVFELDGNQKAISKAVGFDVSHCPERT